MYDLYRYIEHVTHMCLRSWSVLYSDHLNLEIPVDIKKKNIVSARCRMCMLCQSLSLLMEIPIERSNYLTLLCVWLEADITLQTIEIVIALFAFKFQSLYTLPKSKPTAHTCQKSCEEICTCMHVHLLSLNS